MKRIAERVRRLLGLGDDPLSRRWQVAVYGALGLIAVVLLIAWLSGTPLGCAAGGVCE